MKRKLLQQVNVVKAVEVNEYSGTTAKAGEVIELKGERSGVLVVNYAAASGGPSAASLTITAVEGDTNNPATAITFNETLPVIDALTKGVLQIPIKLDAFKKYVKFTATPAFTAGTTPKILASAELVLGDAPVEPIGATTIYQKA